VLEEGGVCVGLWEEEVWARTEVEIPNPSAAMRRSFIWMSLFVVLVLKSASRKIVPG